LLYWGGRVRADVTVQSKVTITAGEKITTYRRILRIKGMNLRVDIEQSRWPGAAIYDLEANSKYVLDPKKKSAELHNLAEDDTLFEKANPENKFRVSIQPTGKESVALGKKCREYAYDLAATDTRERMYDRHGRWTGTMCISEESPESKEIGNFIEQAMREHVLFGAGKDSGPYPRLGTGLFFFQASVHGLLLTRNEQHESQSENETSRGPVSRSRYDFTVESISNEPIPDGAFAVPAGWKVSRGGPGIGLIPVRLKVSPRQERGEQRNPSRVLSLTRR
jgi:hypothetical protein